MSFNHFYDFFCMPQQMVIYDHYYHLKETRTCQGVSILLRSFYPFYNCLSAVIFSYFLSIIIFIGLAFFKQKKKF